MTFAIADKEVIMQIKRMIQRAIRGFGYDLMSLAYSQDYIYDRHLAKVLKQQNIDVVLDVGANIGGYGLLLRQIGFDGSIHSFEPCSAPFQRMRQIAAKDPRWHLHQLGMSDKAGTAEINVMVGSELNSILDPLHTSERMSIEKREVIDLTTLDELELSVDWRRVFLKIDTQGHDLAVMRGGVQRLKQVALLQTEISFLPIYKEMPGATQALKNLDDLGFDVLGLFPVSRDDFGRAREFDCLCVNRSVLSHA